MKTDFCSTGGAIEKDLIVVNPSRECYSCASTETYVNKQRGKPHYHWYGNGVANQYFCLNCENKYYKNPKYKPLTNPRRNKKHCKSCLDSPRLISDGRGHKAKPSSGVTETCSPILESKPICPTKYKT